MQKLIIRTVFVAAFVLLGSSVVSAQTSVSIGVHIGPPPPPRVVHVVEVAPEPDYVWIEGYWYPVGHRYVWHDGYWTRPPYPGARWVAARYERHMYFEGYWHGPRGHVGHDHRWDRERHRDHRRKGHGKRRR
jgi:WXXGXW repeat (2 copies)